jgi:hypothetical protein
VRQLYENEEWEYCAWRDWRRWVIFVVVVVVISGIGVHNKRPIYPDWICLLVVFTVFGGFLWMKDFLRDMNGYGSLSEQMV